MDYVPSVFAYKPSVAEAVQRQKSERQERAGRRRQMAQEQEVEVQSRTAAAEALMMLTAAETHSNISTQTPAVADSDASTQTAISRVMDVGTQTSQVGYFDASTQTEDISLQKTGECTYTGVELIEGSDSKTRFYTGLPTWGVFLHVFSTLVMHIPRKRASRTRMTQRDEFLLVLMRLRLNLLIEDLAYRFNVAKSTVCHIFTTWIDVMAIRLKFLVKWPTKEMVQANMPQVFRETYPRARCIIDCSEVFIEQPLSFQARAQTYSNYKKHNTVKFLIAISPAGTISFISRLWGGRVSDKYLTHQSGFLRLLEPGDTVLADRGFDIADDIGLHGGDLAIPAFTRGKSQLTQREVEFSQRLARVRIHVERVIGLMKNKYTILQGTLPVSLVKHKDKDSHSELANVDKILIACAALTNLCPSVVPS